MSTPRTGTTKLPCVSPYSRPTGSRSTEAKSSGLSTWILLSACLGALVPASAVADTLDLADVIQRASQRPAVRAAESRARAAEGAARIESRQAFLPVVDISAAVTVRDEALIQSTPIGDLELVARDNRTATVAIVQPIVDAGRLLYTAPAARQDARAAALSAARTRDVLAAEAAELFLDIVALDARRAATEALIASLQSRLADLDTLTQVGRTLQRDRLRVGLALDDARQGLLVIDSRRRVATAALARAIGSDGDIDVRFDAASSPPPAPTSTAAVDQLLAQSQRRRQDLRALSAQVRATDKRRSGVWAEWIPRVEAQGAWIYDDGAAYDQDYFFQAMVHLRWTPVAAGTRFARSQTLAAQRAALAHELRDAALGVAVEVQSALADYQIAVGELAVASKAVDQADEALRVTAERYRAGRETVSDLLEAEAIVLDRRTRRDIAQVDRWRSHIRLRRATGELADSL